MLLFHLLFFLLSHIPLTSFSKTSNPGVTLPHSRPAAVTAAGPILSDQPFVVVWNMPTSQCQTHYGIHLDLRDFDIVENRQQHFKGQVIVSMDTLYCTCCPIVLQLCFTYVKRYLLIINMLLKPLRLLV